MKKCFSLFATALTSALISLQALAAPVSFAYQSDGNHGTDATITIDDQSHELISITSVDSIGEHLDFTPNKADRSLTVHRRRETDESLTLTRAGTPTLANLLAYRWTVDQVYKLLTDTALGNTKNGPQAVLEETASKFIETYQRFPAEE